MIVLARWESNDRMHYVELHEHTGRPVWYGYVSRDGGGTLGVVLTAEAAIGTMQARVDRGEFLPGCAKMAMNRVI